MAHHEKVFTLDTGRLANVLARARSMGVSGFGDACAQAALAINTVLLAQQGQLVGCFNEAFYERGQLLGHVAVRVNDPTLGTVFVDADGVPKSFDEVEAWGMLDEHDVDHQSSARKLGFKLDAATAEQVATFEMDVSDVMEHFGADQQKLVAVLKTALEAYDLAQTIEAKGTSQRVPAVGHRPL